MNLKERGEDEISYYVLAPDSFLKQIFVSDVYSKAMTC